MPGRIEWPEYWALRRQAPPKRREEWDLAIGFELDEEHNHITLYPHLQNYVDNCSVPQLVDFLTGAPLQIACLYLYKLPLKYAKKVVLGFRVDDVRLLEAAYRRPPQITAPSSKPSP